MLDGVLSSRFLIRGRASAGVFTNGFASVSVEASILLGIFVFGKLSLEGDGRISDGVLSNLALIFGLASEGVFIKGFATVGVEASILLGILEAGKLSLDEKGQSEGVLTSE